MKLARAREILEVNLRLGGKAMPPDCKQALMLHIEAGKRLESYRTDKAHIACMPLPGEDL